MTPNFEIKVLQVREENLKLRIYIINAEQRIFYTSKEFALKIIWDAASYLSALDCEIYREININQIFNESWLKENTPNYIDSVKFLTVKNHPIDVDFTKMSDRERIKFWTMKSKIPQAEYLIKVTEPKWIAHLRKGTTWQSASVDVIN